MNANGIRIAALPELELPVVFTCRLTHERCGPGQPRFTLTTDLWLVDTDPLPALPAGLRWLAGFDGRDHLGDPDRGIRANLDAFLTRNGVDIAGGRILMLAQPRVLGYAFDPVTFFFCYTGDGHPAWVVAEVRNTFGERHCYLLAAAAESTPVPKRLFVSPFLPLDGSYRMSFRLTPRELTVGVTLSRPVRGRPGALEPAHVATLDGHRTLGPVPLARSLLHPRRMLGPFRTRLLIQLKARSMRRAGLSPARRRPHEPQPGVDRPVGKTLAKGT